MSDRVAVGLWFALAVAVAFAHDSAALWVWFPENPAHDCYRSTRWFRGGLDLDADLTAADLWLMVDDSQKLWVNGQGPLEPVEGLGAGRRYDLRGLLRRGRNVLAIEGYNATSVAGVIARLTLRTADGRELLVTSGEGWRASREAPEGWTDPGFDDSAWSPVMVIGDAFTLPWFGHDSFPMRPFYTDAELAARAARLQSLMASPGQFATDPPIRCELSYVNGMPATVINGQSRPHVLYRASLDPFTEQGRRQIANFRDAGVHLFVPYVTIASCWTAPGEYDFSDLDDQLRAYLSVDPDAYLIVMVRLVQPGWWQQAHPDELVAYGSGDELGGDEMGRAVRASMASRQWLDDTGEAWRALIRHVESQPWGRRVMGYQPAYGISAEWHYFGSWRDEYPDTGPAMTQAFRAWLRDQYRTDAALRKAWAKPEVALDTATVPTMAERMYGDLIAFRDPATERNEIDYYRCHQRVVAAAIEHFARIVKSETERAKICGVYYGYFFGVRPQTQGGHLELDRLMASPDVDYFVAPYSYSQRLMGQDGRLRGLAGAYRLGGKVHILEGDVRTWLHSRDEHGRTQNREQSLAAIRREFSTALIERAGFWYVDFGPDGRGGWFDDPVVMQQAAELYALAERALVAPREQVAQVAVVCDPESCYYVSDGPGVKTAYRLLEDLATELYHTGAPLDIIHLSQLERADLDRYRMIVFLNTLGLSDRQAARIAELREAGKHAMVFLWAPGLTGPDGVSVERACRVTGFPLKLVEQWLPAIIETTGDDPLLAGLPGSEVRTIEVTGATPVAGFGDVANWYNPRSTQVMEQQYTAYEFAPIEGGLRWTFSTIASYSDIHLNMTAEQTDGVGYDVRLEGDAPWLSVQLAIKDANWAEFVSPIEVIVPGRDYRFEYPFAGFDNAPWSREKPDEIAFPLRGCKFVIGETANAGRCTLTITALRSLTGATAVHTVRRFGQGSFTPALVLDPAGGVLTPRGLVPPGMLGMVANTDHVGLLTTGGGPGRTIFSSVPFLPRQVLANLMGEAGVHRYLDNLQDVVRADGRFIAIHTKEGGPRTLNLPVVATVTDALTAEEVGEGSTIALDLPPDSTTVLELAR